MASHPELPQTFRPSKLKVLMLILVSLLFAAGGVWMILRGEPSGWFVTIFFGLCLSVALVQLHPRSSHLTVTSEGLEVCTLFRTSRIRWETVAGFGVWVQKVNGLTSNRMIGINFHPPGPGAGAMRSVARALSGFEGSLPDTYGWKAEELAAFLNFHLDCHRAGVSNRHLP